MEIGLQKRVRPRQASVDLDGLMECYQQADSAPAHAFVATLSPDLLRFFRSQVASRQQAADPLREPWMRNHRVRHTTGPVNRSDRGCMRSRAGSRATPSAAYRDERDRNRRAAGAASAG